MRDAGIILMQVEKKVFWFGRTSKSSHVPEDLI